jgi:DHA1 family bicyclomycin/chloramphenicol resistance-like MFS transporter
MADSLGRKPVILGGTLVFAGAAVACALAQTIDHLIVMRFFHGLAAAASVVINALMRDIYPKEFSRMMSFVMLVTTIAPLVAPMAGGAVLVWFSWHAIFWILALAALLASAMIFFFIDETLPVERRQKFHIRTTLGNFASLFRHKRVLSYMLASGFSFAGMFSFLSAGPFVYIELNHVSPQHFGYYFAEHRLPVCHDHHQQPFCPAGRGAEHVPRRAVDPVCDGYLAGGECVPGRGLLGAGGGRCGLCRLRFDGLFQRDGGDPR